MPNYGVAQAGSNFSVAITLGNPVYTWNQGLNLTALAPGDKFFLFNAETVTAPQSSVAVSVIPTPGDPCVLTFEIDFASSPTDSVLIQGANTDLDADYQTLYTSTNKQHDNYTDTVAWRFYRAQVASQSGGGAISVSVNRR